MQLWLDYKDIKYETGSLHNFTFYFSGFHKNNMRIFVPLHLPSVVVHLKYVLNWSTKPIMLDVVPRNNPSGMLSLK